MSKVEKVIFLIYDGLGDRPIKEFGYKTPLEAAKTPNFDAIAKKSVCGVSNALGRGVRPGSDTSHLEIFGYPIDTYYTGRGPIEVAGLGIKLQKGDVAFRGNFATIDENFKLVDRRAGRIEHTDELVKAVDGLEIDGVKVHVVKGVAHRVGVVFRGKGLSSNILDADPHVEGAVMNHVVGLDNTKEAKFTAEITNKFIRKSYEILKDLPFNKQRIKEGKQPANIISLRGAGMYPTMPSFNEKYGLKACCIAGGGLYKGIGAFLGMDLIDVPTATALPNTDVKAKFVEAKKQLSNYDFVFVHVKATDSLAEDGNFEGKKQFIEKCDVAMKEFVDLPDNVMLVVTADHSTACELKEHTADPVPIMMCSPHVRIDNVATFSEREFAYGGLGRMQGKDIMPTILNVMGKLHLIGA